MAQANFSFISDASSGDQFTVVSFSGNEAISSLYRYEIEIKAPLSAAIDLDDVLDNPARFVTELDGTEYPVYGVLSSFDELQTVQGYVYYRAVLVPKLWWLSIYKTNEIYTEEKTVDKIIQTVLENADFTSGTDFDLGGLDASKFLKRDYVCQFGESDFDFISRLMENEGVFYYFDNSGSAEKIIFINDTNYLKIPRPDLIFDVTAQTSLQHDSINAWSCRKQRLPAGVTVRDFNPEQPSLDISDTMPIDDMGQGTEYIYGVNVRDGDEATYLSEIRAEEQLCSKTRLYGESSVTRLQAGYVFKLKEGHPNSNYNGVEYLAIEVSHEGQHLDAEMSEKSRKRDQLTPQYRNNFVAIEATEQYRPPRKTPKPRFFGTMTAFIYAETDSAKPEVNEHGEYRVHLPFDRADGTKNSNDPHRKSSAWMRMAQPYVGQDQGLYFPLTGGTEVLLTFINGDPDQPIISAAIPNAAQPSLMESHPAWSSIVTSLVKSEITGNTHNISSNSDRLDELEGTPPYIPSGDNAHFINDGTVTLPQNMIPPWTGEAVSVDPKNISPVYDESLIKFKFYDETFNAVDMADDHLDKVSTDRGAGDNYVYANARTFAYPQHERVYFIGTFHEDFHVKDDFMNPSESWTGVREQFNFPAPGEQFPEKDPRELDENEDPIREDPSTSSDAVVNPTGIRGVSEDKRWGDQMTYAWGRSFNWAGGPAMGEGGSFAVYNYGNGYTENLQIATGGTSADLSDAQKSHHDDYLEYKQFTNNLGSTSVEKTFGPTYSYQKGFSLDVKVGDSHSKVYGNSDSIVDGDSYSETRGWTLDIFHGNKRELLMGADTELKLAVDTEVKLAGDFTFHGGISTELMLGAKGEIMLGFETGVQAAGFLKYTTGIGIDRTEGKIRDTSVEVHKKKVALEKALAEINKGELHVMKNQVVINAALIHLFS